MRTRSQVVIAAIRKGKLRETSRKWSLKRETSARSLARSLAPAAHILKPEQHRDRTAPVQDGHPNLQSVPYF